MSQTIANLVPVLISMKKENIIPSVECLAALFIISFFVAFILVFYVGKK